MTTIRLATVKDIARLLELYRQLDFDTSQSEMQYNPDDYQKAFADINYFPGQELLVAEDGGEVVGTMVLVTVPSLAHNGSPWAMLEHIVVDEKRRRQGIGRLLMDYAFGRAREAGCYKIQLSSDKRRTAAHEFYRSLGFEASAHGFRLYF